MQPLIALLAIYLIAVLVIIPIWAIVKIVQHGGDIGLLADRFRSLENELRELRSILRALPAQSLARPQPDPVAAPAPVSVPVPPTRPLAPAPEPVALPVEPVPIEPLAAVPVAAISAAPPEPAATAIRTAQPEPAAPPPLLPAAPRPAPMPAAPLFRRPELPPINWEQFMGAKLFAWLGGLALFLGVAFFVKYSFEHDLIPPQVRVALGFLVGAGLIVGGLRVPMDRYRITGQTLVAAGVVSLYAVTFACNAVYHFAFFGPFPTFLLMTLITAAAFLLAVRLDAQVVAVLGILGGFLTPVLINTGHDNPAGLFTYLGLLVVGLVAVALHRGWLYLVPLGAAGTLLMLVAWAGKFYAPEKTLTAMMVCLGFCALFAAAAEAARRRLTGDAALATRTALVFPAAALAFAWFFLGYPPVAAQTGLLIGFIIAASLFVFYLAWREQMGGLVLAAAVATALLLRRWAGEMVLAERAPVLVAVFLGFGALYFLTYVAARRLGRASQLVLFSAVGMPAVALVFAFILLQQPAVAARPGLILPFIFASDVLLLAVAWLDDRLPRLHLAAGGATFLLLGDWFADGLTNSLLPWALAASLALAALHTAFPLVLERRRPGTARSALNQLFPPLALLLLLFPIYRFEAISLLIWPAILLVDAVAIVLAVLSASLAAVAAVLILTLVATGMCLFQVQASALLPPSLLLILGIYSVFFFAAGLWLSRRLAGRLGDADPRFAGWFGQAPGEIPAFSALLPFLLLIMVCTRLAVPDPSAVFALGLLLVVLVLGLTRIMMAEWLPACALAGMAALELVWHSGHFLAARPGIPLLWYAGFYALFAAYPFVFRRAFARSTGPWAVAALSGVAHFYVVYQAVKRGWPNNVNGLVPALFAIAPMASLAAVLRTDPANPKRLNQLAWFGGAALFFITLIFPIQFDRQWLTVAWALEGAALLWLYHRVPHPGLRLTGAALLAIAFVRLGLNPAVFGYHGRGSLPILNWYLYAYGLTIASLLAGGRLLAPPRQMIGRLNAQPLANAGAVILLFLLLNIEIADFFTAPGARSLAFQFSGNFARDMSYTIGWAVFALGLLAAGLWRGQKVIRYAAIALLSTALLKLFFHDLARLEALYRIGALFAVAVIAILASFAYQRFLPANAKPDAVSP